MLSAFGAAHFDTIAKLDRPPEPASIPGRVRRYAGGAGFNASRQHVRAGGRATLHTPGPVEQLRPYAAGVALAPIGASDGGPSYTAILDPAGDLVVAVADMDCYDRLQPDEADARGASHLLVDANLSAAFLEALVAGLAPEVKLYAMAVSPAKIGRLSSFAERIDILFANRRERQAANLPVRAALVTDGPGAMRFESADGSISHRVDPQPVVDVTGAGDAVAGTFLFALMNGSDPATALAMAAAAAAETIAAAGPFPFEDPA